VIKIATNSKTVGIDSTELPTTYMAVGSADGKSRTLKVDRRQPEPVITTDHPCRLSSLIARSDDQLLHKSDARPDVQKVVA
jgi:hypothetical protein